MAFFVPFTSYVEGFPALVHALYYVRFPLLPVYRQTPSILRLGVSFMNCVLFGHHLVQYLHVWNSNCEVALAT